MYGCLKSIESLKPINKIAKQNASHSTVANDYSIKRFEKEREELS
jgi:hypothetical protein